MSDSTSDRIQWIDVLRGIAIYAIRIGHYSTAGGPLYPFVYTFQIQLFFFISGLFAYRSRNLPAGEALKKFAKRILLPYIIVSVINVIFFTLYNGTGIRDSLYMMLNSLAARRNDCFISTLWFFPCLFIMTALYYLLNKLIKNRYLLLAVCFALTVAMRIFKEEPQWLFSADSAVLYIFYYALGDCVMPFAERFSFKELTKPKKTFFIAFACAVTAFAAVWYSGLESICGYLGISPGAITVKFINIFAAAIMIFFFVLLAMLLKNAAFIGEIGRNTLILAGTELLSIVLFTEIFAVLGLRVTAEGPLEVLIASALTLVFSYFVIAKPLAAIFPAVFGKKKLLKTN